VVPQVESPHVLLAVASRIARLQDEALEDLDIQLTMRQYRVLLRVDQGYATLTILARLARRTTASLSETIDGLVRRGLLDRKAGTDDRRVVMLGITDKGKKALSVAQERLDALAQDLMAALSARAAQDLVRHLNVLFTASETLRRPTAS
jgi:DNA-binding MarR family transcriptional regulator